MSIHVTPSFEGLAITPRIVDRAPAVRRAAAAGERPIYSDAATSDRLSVQLDHVGMSVAVSALPAGQGAGTHVVRPGMPQAEFDRLLEKLSAEAGLGAGNIDPVLDRLTLALEATRTNGSEYAGLYADALRLAILTRRLAMPAGATTHREILEPEARAVEPVEARRPKSGLPKWRLKRVTAYVEENLAESITLADMACAAGLSRMHFAAQFRVATGMRPHDYLLRRRIETAQQMMVESSDTLIQIALSVGFQTQAHFTTVFRKIVGETPFQWRSVNKARH